MSRSNLNQTKKPTQRNLLKETYSKKPTQRNLLKETYSKKPTQRNLRFPWTFPFFERNLLSFPLVEIKYKKN